MKAKAAQEIHLSPLLLTRDAITGADTESLPSLPSEAALKQRIRRVRRRDMPNNPANFDDIQELPAQFREVDGANFIVFHNGAGNENRVMIFGTNNGLSEMSQSDY